MNGKAAIVVHLDEDGDLRLKGFDDHIEALDFQKNLGWKSVIILPDTEDQNTAEQTVGAIRNF